MDKTILIHFDKPLTRPGETPVVIPTYYGPFRNDQEARWFRDRNGWAPEVCQIQTLHAVE